MKTIRHAFSGRGHAHDQRDSSFPGIPVLYHLHPKPVVEHGHVTLSIKKIGDIKCKMVAKNRKSVKWKGSKA